VSRWDTLAERMPFPVLAISIDSGAELMAEFETACPARGIRLFVLPPRSPKLHGAVERAKASPGSATDWKRRVACRGWPWPRKIGV
jgi:hypothetical protein